MPVQNIPPATGDAASAGETPVSHVFTKYSVGTAETPFTIPSWESVVEIHNDSSPIEVILPAMTENDVGKEIKFWMEHNPANYKFTIKAPNTTDYINNITGDGPDVAKAEFSQSNDNYFRITAQTLGAGECYIDNASLIYNALRYFAKYTSTTTAAPWSHIELSSVPTNFMTSNASWWFAVKIEHKMINDGLANVLFGTDKFFVGYRGDGLTFLTSGEVGYQQTLSQQTVVENGSWIIYQYDHLTDTYDAWVNGLKVLSNTANGETPSAVAPNAVWFGTKDQSLTLLTPLNLIGMTNTNYNTVYTPMATTGYMQAGVFYTDPNFKFYSHDAGGGTWYLVIWDNQTASYSATTSTVDPATYINTTAISASGTESFTAFVSTVEGIYVPYELDDNVDFANYAGPTGYGVNLRDCAISNISIGSGNLSDGDAALFTNSLFRTNGLSLSGTVTNEWTFSNSAPVTQQGAIDMIAKGSQIIFTTL